MWTKFHRQTVFLWTSWREKCAAALCWTLLQSASFHFSKKNLPVVICCKYCPKSQEFLQICNWTLCFLFLWCSVLRSRTAGTFVCHSAIGLVAPFHPTGCSSGSGHAEPRSVSQDRSAVRWQRDGIKPWFRACRWTGVCTSDRWSAVSPRGSIWLTACVQVTRSLLR